MPASEGEAEYLPRPQLSIAPKVIGSLQFVYPDFAGDKGYYRFIVSLFIDEEGAVRRVRIESADVPLPIEYVVRQSLLNSRFSPGEVNGEHVRSHIRMELSFASTTPTPTPSRSTRPGPDEHAGS